MKILAATDGSEHGDRAVKEAGKLAKALGGSLTAVFVIQDLPAYGAANFHHPLYDSELYGALTHNLEKVASEVLSRAGEFFEDSGVEGKIEMLTGNAAEMILRLASEGEYDLIVVGNRGLGTLSGLLLGSVSNKVVQHAETSVMVVK